MDLVTTYGDLHEKEFKQIGEFVQKNYGVKLYPNKKVLVKSRLQSRLAALGIKSFKEYCEFTLNDNNASEVEQMIDKLTTNKTDFFREDDHFEYLSGTLLTQYLFKSGKQHIDVWSAGCSSGEEPYSIGMVLDSQKNKIKGFDYKIYASDISINVLKKASKAIYPLSDIEDIPVEYKKKYLLRCKDDTKQQIRIAPSIRDKVTLFKHNLLSDKLPFKKHIDIIFCRNTLIYFDKPTQLIVVKKLLAVLNKGGYLFLGHSESLINVDFQIKSVFPSVYKKI